MLKAGRTVAQVAHDLQISDQTIYTWRRQSLVDAGQEPGLTSVEKAELASARRRIAELETELAIHRRATELLEEAVPQKPGSSRSRRWSRRDCRSRQRAGSWRCLGRGSTPGEAGHHRPARCGTPG
ncbi:transposase [Lentzea tibetensis]|uniref:Transposase n=1 Tax=Lentzea tibetensis TaxID=2591470 RepID=A0A563EF85_9PSEU|nr:transposase [Lentzea tibetensis]